MKQKHLVEHTNDWSIDSKRSMVELNYFKDDFIKFFSVKKRRSPLINIGYYVRASIIDRVLKHFQRVFTSEYQVISLGAGFDTSYFRLFSSDNNVKYVEIDLHSVVKKKVNILLNNHDTNKLLKNVKVENDGETCADCSLVSENYIIFSQNLDDADQLDMKLKTFGIDYRIPTVLLSECAITYMDETSCTKLCKFLSEKFINAAFLIYEQINPQDGFGQFMMRHFEMIQSPLKALTRYNQVKDQTHYYINNGWKECFMHRVMDLYVNITPLEEFLNKIRLEPMDEWEEFHLTCLHYSLYIASSGYMIDIAKSFFEPVHICHLPIVETNFVYTIQDLENPIKRFGHQVIPLDNDNFVMFGGVGVEKNCHKKCSSFKIIDLQNKVVKESETSLNQFAVTHIASCSVRVENVSNICFLLHGGCKSPSYEGDSNAYMIHYEPPSLFQLHPINTLEGSPAPCHRWRHSVISSGSDIFLFGGRTCDMLVLDDLWMLTVNWKETSWTGIWTHLDKGPPGRFSHACVSISNGGFIICGGLDKHFQPLGDIWQWLPSIGWSHIDVDQSIPRYGHTCHLISDRLFLVGGINFHPSNPGISIIDLKICFSSHFSLPNSSPLYPIMLHNHHSVLTKDETDIIIFGGGGNCFSFGTYFNRCIINIPTNQFMLK